MAGRSLGLLFDTNDSFEGVVDMSCHGHEEELTEYPAEGLEWLNSGEELLLELDRVEESRERVEVRRA